MVNVPLEYNPCKGVQKALFLTLPLEVLAKGDEKFPYFVQGSESDTLNNNKEIKTDKTQENNKIKDLEEEDNLMEKGHQDIEREELTNNVDTHLIYSQVNSNENMLKEISEFVWFDSFR